MESALLNTQARTDICLRCFSHKILCWGVIEPLKVFPHFFPSCVSVGSCAGPVIAVCIMPLVTQVQGIPLQHSVGYLSKDNQSRQTTLLICIYSFQNWCHASSGVSGCHPLSFACYIFLLFKLQLPAGNSCFFILPNSPLYIASNFDPLTLKDYS